MKYYIIFLPVIFLLCSGSGCVTMQKSVDDVYLSEMTDEDSTNIKKIEMDIVDQKKEKDNIENNLKIAEQEIVVNHSDISQIEATKNLLHEKEKLYSIAEDNENLADIQNQLKKIKEKEAKAKANLEYNRAKRDEIKALLEVKKAQLAVKVAEFDYEKAKIAKEYQSKRPEKFRKDIIDETKYEKFLTEQIKNLEEKQEQHRKAKLAKEKLQKTGEEAQQ